MLGLGIDPGGRTASPSPGGSFRQALALATAQVGAKRTPPTAVASQSPFVMGLPDTGGYVPLPGVAGEGMAVLGTGYLMDMVDLTSSTRVNPFAPRWRGAGVGSITAAAAELTAARLASKLDLSRFRRATTARPPRRRGGAANSGPMMDAASRILAARSRARNAAAGRARGDSLIGMDTASIWAHLRRAGDVRSANSSRFLFNDRLFDRFRKNFAKQEGGLNKNETGLDPGAETDRGISTNLLSLLRKTSEWGHLSVQVENLTPAHINNILYCEFYLAPGIPEVVAAIRDASAMPREAASAMALAELLFNSGALSGPKPAGQAMQKSLDEHVGGDLREWTTTQDGRTYLDYDGIVGSKTRAKLAKAIQEGKIVDVNNTMLANRLRFLSGLISVDPSQRAHWDNWRQRTESYRM